MPNYNYCCLNTKGCSQRKNFVVDKPESDKEVEELCPECGKVLKRIGVIPHGGHAKFASLSPSDKRKVLDKRSKDHFNRTGVADSIHHKKEEAVRKLHEKFTGGQTIKRG